MSEVLVWARRWAKRPNAAEHELLEVTNAATLAIVRAAYHKLARFAHPDLHRAAVTAAELEEITETFARVSNAYSILTARLRKEGAATGAESAAGAASATKATTPPPAGAAPSPSPSPPRSSRPSRPTGGTAPPVPPGPAAPRATATGTEPPGESAAASPPTQGAGKAAAGTAGRVPVSTTGPATGLSSKAMLHYRRAELCLRRGELIEAKLHLRLALASDPQSAFLRKALDDLERQ